MPAVDLESLGLQTLIEGLSREKIFLLFLPKIGGTIALPAPQVPSALVQVNNYETVINFFHISHNLT